MKLSDRDLAVWTTFYAAVCSDPSITDVRRASVIADTMLEEWRKRAASEQASVLANEDVSGGER